MKRKVVVLGGTGSIGQNALDIIKHFPQDFDLVGFSYHNNKNLALEIQKSHPASFMLCTKELEEDSVCDAKIKDKEVLEELKKKIDIYKVFLEKTQPNIVINGISGAFGLLPSYVALSLGLDLALANKESIVLAYHILAKLSQKNGANIIPLDSEHWAIFDLLRLLKDDKIAKIIITASGGAFRFFPSEKLKHVSVEDAIRHPTWKMGKKISIDSASLANKALEVIEATKLFSFSAKDIIVSIHKESIVHSMVQTKGGAIYASLSPPDMRAPIFGALMFPNNIKPYLAPLDFNSSFSLSFSPPRYKDFPMLDIGFRVAELGFSYPIAFNATNEVAVEAFSSKKIGFLDIPSVVEDVLQKDWNKKTSMIEEVYILDRQARKIALEIIQNKYIK